MRLLYYYLFMLVTSVLFFTHILFVVNRTFNDMLTESNTLICHCWIISK